MKRTVKLSLQRSKSVDSMKSNATDIVQITQKFIGQEEIKKIITKEVKKQIGEAIEKEVFRQLNVQQHTESDHSSDKLSNKSTTKFIIKSKDDIINMSPITPENLESSLLKDTAQALTVIDIGRTHNEMDKYVSAKSTPSKNENISKNHKVPVIAIDLIKATQMQELNIAYDKDSEDNKDITPRTHMQTLGIVKGLIEDLKEDKVECKNKEQLKAILDDPSNLDYCLEDATIKAINELSENGKNILVKKIAQIEGFDAKKPFLHGLLDAIINQAKSIIIDSAREGIKDEETSKKAETMINNVFNKVHSHDVHNHDQELIEVLDPEQY